MIDTGITYATVIPGLVPELEEREAARFCGYNWREWSELPRQERIEGVAHARLVRLVDMHREGAVNSAMEQRQKVR